MYKNIKKLYILHFLNYAFWAVHFTAKYFFGHNVPYQNYEVKHRKTCMLDGYFFERDFGCLFQIYAKLSQKFIEVC